MLNKSLKLIYSEQLAREQYNYMVFLSRAQLDCNYHYTSQELVHESDKCTKHELGEKYGREVMRLGMDQFEARKRGDMKGQLCNTVLKEFPNYIKK